MTMDADDYFKDFDLCDYTFIVVNNIDNPVPLTWKFGGTRASGLIYLGGKTLRDPEKIGEELHKYLEERPSVPFNVSLKHTNSIEKYFDYKLQNLQ